MLKQCSSIDYQTVLNYIGNDYSRCLYLYMDLLKYGIDSERISVYIQKQGKCITSVLLSYYSCLHLFSRSNDFDENEVINLLFDGSFKIVYCARPAAEKIWNSWPNKINATITSGWVAQIKEVDKPDTGQAAPAEDEDFKQIVQMIYDDEDIGKSYDYITLARQLRERANEGFTRNIVIKDGKKVVAHACTNAEVDKIAVVAELVVDKEYRRKGLASDIWRSICTQLLKEGKEVYSFYYSLESQSLHRKIGFNEVCEWGKIVF